jgi:predicted DNA-binding protein (MmcQ/YjbR family)
MRVPQSKLGFDDNTVIEVLNLKIPTELFGSFGKEDFVFPAYHMNKLHWVSVCIENADDEVIKFLLNASFTITSKKRNRR